MRLPRRLRLVAIRKGKATSGLLASIRSIHRLHRGHKTKNPRKKFLAKVEHTKLRTFGVPRAGTHMHHARHIKPKAHRTAAAYRKPRSHR